MDPVLEVTEESDNTKISKLIYSPRIKLYSDKIEDLNTPKMKSSHSHFFTNQSEVIAEDNNENLVEIEKIHKRSNNSKILESSMDKTEVVDNFNEIKIDAFEENHIQETIEEDPEDEDIEILNFIKCK